MRIANCGMWNGKAARKNQRGQKQESGVVEISSLPGKNVARTFKFPGDSRLGNERGTERGSAARFAIFSVRIRDRSQSQRRWAGAAINIRVRIRSGDDLVVVVRIDHDRIR